MRGADPEFFEGGGGGVEMGGGGGLTNKNSDVSVCFLVLNLYIRSPLVKFKGNYHFLRFQVGVQLFSGGGGGGPIAYSYRNPYNLWFPGGGSGSHFVVSNRPYRLLNLHLHLTYALANRRRLT